MARASATTALKTFAAAERSSEMRGRQASREKRVESQQRMQSYTFVNRKTTNEKKELRGRVDREPLTVSVRLRGTRMAASRAST